MYEKINLIVWTIEDFFMRNQQYAELMERITLYYHHCPLYRGKFFIGGSVIHKEDQTWEAHFPNTLFEYKDGIQPIIDHEMIHVIDYYERWSIYLDSVFFRTPFNPHDDVFKEKLKKYSLFPDKSMVEFRNNLESNFNLSRYCPANCKYYKAVTKYVSDPIFGGRVSYNTLADYKDSRTDMVKLSWT